MTDYCEGYRKSDDEDNKNEFIKSLKNLIVWHSKDYRIVQLHSDEFRIDKRKLIFGFGYWDCASVFYYWSFFSLLILYHLSRNTSTVKYPIRKTIKFQYSLFHNHSDHFFNN